MEIVQNLNNKENRRNDNFQNTICEILKKSKCNIKKTFLKTLEHKPVNIAVAGTGFGARTILPALKESARESNLVMIKDRNS